MGSYECSIIFAGKSSSAKSSCVWQGQWFLMVIHGYTYIYIYICGDYILHSHVTIHTYIIYIYIYMVIIYYIVMSPYIHTYIYIYHHIWLANLPCTSAGLEEAANDMRRRVQVAMALDLRLGPWLVVGPCSFWHHPDDHLDDHPDDLMGLNWGLRIAAPYAKVLGNHFNPEDFLSVSESALSLAGVGLGLMVNSQLAGSFKNWHSRTWGHRKVCFIDGTPDLSRWKCEDSNGTTPPKVRERVMCFFPFPGIGWWAEMAGKPYIEG